MHLKKQENGSGAAPVVIEAKNVSFSFGRQPVLKSVSFTVRKGDYLGIIGPNGGGKTTMVKLLLGLLKPRSGSVRVLGQKPQMRAHHATIGYVPQRSAIGSGYIPATVEDVIRSSNVRTSGLRRRLVEENDAHVIARALSVSGIKNLRKRLVSELSGGQYQRVLIARSLSRGPQILILDEPTAGVDVATQQQFYDFLRKLNRDYGITIILVSHDVDVVTTQVNYVLCLNTNMICHTSARNFMAGNYLKKLYGKNVKFVVHH